MTVRTDQKMAPMRPAKTTVVDDNGRGDDAGADGRRDGRAGEGADEVERAGHQEGEPDGQGPRRDDGGDRVGRVVQAVVEVEDEGHGDGQQDHGA